MVGCGNIAGGFDMARSSEQPPLTHMGAYCKHPDFDVQACIEPDAQRRERFMAHWKIPAGYSSFDALMQRPPAIDVVSICSPTAAHALDLECALALKPLAIFCEKPVTLHAAQTQHWVEACANAHTLLAVNHTRRWAPDVTRLKQELASGVWGSVHSAVGFYNKGLLNNGGHMLDLLIHLFGPLQVQWAGAVDYDYWEDDPTVAAVLRTASGAAIHLCTARAPDYALFELEIITSMGVLAMENGGMNWRERRVVEDPQFKGYRRLDSAQPRQGEYPSAMTHAVANLCAAVRGGDALASTGDSALQAQRLCERIRHLAERPTVEP